MVIVDSIEGLAHGGLAGKFVLSRLDPRKTRRAFCEAGVAGVLFDLPVEGCRGGVAWTKFGWGGLDLWEGATPLVGLSISAEAGDELRALYQQHGRLVVKIRVDVKKYPGSHGVVSGLIPGENPDEEIWAVAHSADRAWIMLQAWQFVLRCAGDE